jgi:hypothetical protein
MHTHQVVFYSIFAVVFVLVAVGFLLTFVGGERVGAMECPFQTKMGGGRLRLTIARESAGTRVQLRVRRSASVAVHRIGSADARRLATLLESAAARLREP